MHNFKHLTRFILIRLAVLGTLLFPIINSLSCYSQIDIITERLREDFVNQAVNKDMISVYLKTLKKDGSWEDIDYRNSSVTNWPALSHSMRLKEICIAYNQPDDIFYHDTLVKVQIRNIIDFYIATEPKSDNWWLNAIGAPVNLGSALILMKTGDTFGFDQKTLVKYSDELLNYYAASVINWPEYNSGANKIWFLKSSIYKACINENEAELNTDFLIAFEEAKVMESMKEGIKSDYSFHQHRKQLYTGGYGLSFMNDILFFGTLAYGTTYNMNSSQLQVLTNTVLDGFQWFCQRSVFDFGAVGRYISRPGATSAISVLSFITSLKEMNAPRADELTGCYNFIDGKAGFQYPGNKFFWESDIMVHHGSDFYFSVKVPFSGTTGTETVNGENLKRKYLPWGATNIMIDGDEYYNIFPVWDWSRIPGTTSYIEDIQPDTDGQPRLVSISSYAGGVTDGVFGLAAYDYSCDGIEGRKAWFFTPEAMYCLGAGINAVKNKAVITTINQCFFSDYITGKNGLLKSVMDTDEETYNSIKWVHHDRVGYFLPAGGELTVKNSDQTGSWKDISTSQPSDTLTEKVFSIWINHGVAPSDANYEYIVVPSQNIKQFVKWIRTNPLKMVLNNKDIQAVYDRNAKLFAVAFYLPGTITLERGLTVSVDNACLLLLQNINNGKGYKISVSDPTRILGNEPTGAPAEVKIRLTKVLSGPGSVINPDTTSTLSIILPSGDETGKTVSGEYVLK